MTISSNQGDPKDDADVFVREDSDAGKAIYAEHEKDCADEAASAEQREKDKPKREADRRRGRTRRQLTRPPSSR